MSEATYNGWTNYETWLVNLWMDNDGMSEELRDRAPEILSKEVDFDRDDAITQLAREIQDRHDEMTPETVGVFSDLLSASLGRVDWRDIARHYVDDVQVFSAGWNMPGYMPGGEPACFLDADAARGYVADEMETRADDLEPDAEQPDGADLQQVAQDRETCEELRRIAEEIRAGLGELGVTVAGYHYFVTAV